MMCKWMDDNHMLLDIDDDTIPEALLDSHKVRYRTLEIMFKMLEESADGGGHKIDEAATTTGYGCSIHFSSFLMQLYMF